MISSSNSKSVLKKSEIGSRDTDSQLRLPKMSNLKASFESATSADLGISTGSKCHVCFKGFILRRKHVCRVCLNAVCADHSVKKAIEGEEMIRICDHCVQEKAQTDLKLELEQDIDKLNEELAQSKEINDRLNREYFDRTSVLNQLEEAIKEFENEQLEIQDKLKQELETEQQRILNNRAKLDDLRKTLDESESKEQVINEKVRNTEQEIDHTRSNIQSLTEQSEEYKDRIDKINERIEKSLSIHEADKLLCPKCSRVINDAVKCKLGFATVAVDEDESSDVILERKKIAENMREFRKTLIEIEKEKDPEKTKECLMM